MKPYKSPAPKIAAMVNLRLMVILSFHTAKTGNRSMEKSETMLMTDVASIDASLLMHAPGISGFCNLARGLQAKMKQTKMLA